jgi:hypothetical protein
MRPARHTLALSALVLSGLTLAASLPALAAGVQGHASPQADYRPLGKGSVHVRFAATKQGGLIVAPSTDLASVVGIVVSVPARQSNLVAVVGGRATGKSQMLLALLNAKAKVGVDGASLAGAQPQVAIQDSLAGVHEIEVKLITRDGHQVPLTFHADNFAGQTIGRTF